MIYLSVYYNAITLFAYEIFNIPSNQLYIVKHITPKESQLLNKMVFKTNFQ